MRKDWKMPGPLSLTKLRSAHRVSEFISPSSMQTSTCRGSWRAFLARRSGWHQDSAKSAASPKAGPKERLHEETGGSGDGLRRRPEVSKRGAPRSVRARILILNPTFDLRPANP